MTPLYSKKVMKHFTHPKNMGEIKNPDAVGEVMNDQCGDMMKVFLKIEGDKIKDIKFKTMGCAAAIASSDALCDIANGKTLGEALKIRDKDIIKKLKGLPTIKIHCSVLGTKALQKAIGNWENSKKK